MDANRAINYGKCEAGEDSGLGWSRMKALLLSLAIPGAGQLYGNKTLAALIWLPAVVLGYFVSPLLGFTAHSVCMIDATQRNLKAGRGDARDARISGYATAAFGALIFALVIFLCLMALGTGPSDDRTVGSSKDNRVTHMTIVPAPTSMA